MEMWVGRSSTQRVKRLTELLLMPKALSLHREQSSCKWNLPDWVSHQRCYALQQPQRALYVWVGQTEIINVSSVSLGPIGLHKGTGSFMSTWEQQYEVCSYDRSWTPATTWHFTLWGSAVVSYSPVHGSYIRAKKKMTSKIMLHVSCIKIYTLMSSKQTKAFGKYLAWQHGL